MICTLTYGLLFDDYRPPYASRAAATACEEQKARAVRDYWAGVLSDAGQATLPGNDYDALPLNILEWRARVCSRSAGTRRAAPAPCPPTTRGRVAPPAARPAGGRVQTSAWRPTRRHVTPLANPSCTPPVGTSTQLTTSAAGRQSASARYDVLVGNTATPADEADVRITGSITDVLNKAGGTEYTGQVILTTTIRVADKRNGDTAVLSGTVQDADLGIRPCVSTPDPVVGGSCSINTTVDSLLPNFAPRRNAARSSA